MKIVILEGIFLMALGWLIDGRAWKSSLDDTYYMVFHGIPLIALGAIIAGFGILRISLR